MKFKIENFRRQVGLVGASATLTTPLDTVWVAVACPLCGTWTQKAIKRLVQIQHVTCENCGVTINFD